ncbi:MAG: hypothetical protein GX223_10785 [Tepidanaerobacter sp.]|nr:hypothetical protein [Tepidanaerobacter sp.]
MGKKLTAFLLTALLLTMPLSQALAADAESNIDKVLNYIEDKVDEIGKDNTKDLLDVVKELYEEETLDKFFGKLDEDLKQRLSNKGIDQASLKNAAEYIKAQGFYTATKDFIDDMQGKKGEYKEELKKVYNDIFTDSNAPLNPFYNSVNKDYGSFKDFLTEVKQLEIDLLGLNENNGLILEHIDGKIRISELKSKAELTKQLNEFLPDGIELSEDDISSLTRATNHILADLDDSKILKDVLEEMNYEISPIEIPEGRHFYIEAMPLERTTAGIKAIVNVVPVSENHTGKAVVLFQLMKGTTPGEIVALENEIISEAQFIAHFPVKDPSNETYKVRVFVLNRFDNDLDSVPDPLAEPVELN